MFCIQTVLSPPYTSCWVNLWEKSKRSVICTIQSVSQKNWDQMFSVISFIKLGWFWWNLVDRFLNKSAAKSCKQFPPYLKNVSTLGPISCETWNAHRGRCTIELLQKESLEFIPPQLWPPYSPDLNPVENNMSEILQEKVYKTDITDLELCHFLADTQRHLRTYVPTDKWLPQYSDMIQLVHSILSHCFSLFRSVMHILHTCSSIVLTCCNQQHSNLANLEATDEVG